MTKRRRTEIVAVPAEAGAPHIPVMLAEVLAALAPCERAAYIDATFGAGGYSRAILEAVPCRVLALDRDPQAVEAGAAMRERYPGRLTIEPARFGMLDEVARSALGDTAVDGVVLDLGVSSMQLDQAERGFSFQADGPLDMRMGAGGDAGAGASAADAVNTLPEGLLADILYQLGEEKRSRAIAAAVVRRRATQPFTRTKELADLVASVPGTRRPDGRHPATRTFQALRIWVNDELGELARGLVAAEALLAPGGRLVVVGFHSLEDRIVKRFLATRCGKAGGTSRHLPTGNAPPRDPSFRLVNPKPLSPSNEEIAANPRARSARLRAAQRTEAAPWSDADLAGELPAVLLQR